MAPKRSAPTLPPPPVASSEETAAGSSSDESEEVTTLAPPAPTVSGEESDASDEEESEEEEEENKAPLASSSTKNKPPPPQNREESETSDEEEGESSESEMAPPLSPVPKQGMEGKGPKILSPKRQAFQRIWSTEDEVRILEALAAHRREHGALPQIDALVASLAGSLDNRGFGRKELQAKINTLRRRYEATAKKAEVPSKGHDRRLFDLSKSVWGSDNAAAVAGAGANTVNGTARREFGEMCELYPHLAEEVKALEATYPGLFKRDFGKLDDGKARALDAKIKKQRIAEIAVELRRGDLTKEVTKALAELVQ